MIFSDAFLAAFRREMSIHRCSDPSSLCCGHAGAEDAAPRGRRVSSDDKLDFLRSKLSEGDYAKFCRDFCAKYGKAPSEDSIEDVEPRERDEFDLGEDSAEAFRQELLQGMGQAMAKRQRDAEAFARRHPTALRIKVAQDRKPDMDPRMTTVHKPGAETGDRWAGNDWLGKGNKG